MALLAHVEILGFSNHLCTQYPIKIIYVCSMHRSLPPLCILSSSIAQTRTTFSSTHLCVSALWTPKKVLNLLSIFLMLEGTHGVKGGTCVLVLTIFSCPTFSLHISLLQVVVYSTNNPPFSKWFFYLGFKKREKIHYLQNSSIRCLGLL
jgi:hypothetical protein